MITIREIVCKRVMVIAFANSTRADRAARAARLAVQAKLRSETGWWLSIEPISERLLILEKSCEFPIGIYENNFFKLTKALLNLGIRY